MAGTFPEEITSVEWDKYIKFWNDPKNLARAAQNRLNRQKSMVISRQGSRSLARLRDEMVINIIYISDYTLWCVVICRF